MNFRVPREHSALAVQQQPSADKGMKAATPLWASFYHDKRQHGAAKPASEYFAAELLV
jgi:hypothetical protein